jgi:hypothetical protein
MAYLPQKLTDKVDANGNPIASQEMNAPQVGGSGSNIAGSGSMPGSPQPAENNPQSYQGGVAGGSPFTNIQSYLNANQGNRTASNILDTKVGGKIKSEKDRFSTEAGKVKGQADTTLASQVGKDTASKLVQEYSNYENPGNDPSGSVGSGQYKNYGEAVKAVQGGLKDSYGGPTKFDFNYQGLGNDVQKGLGSQEGLNAYLAGQYGEAAGTAGGQLTSGQLALQNQLASQDVGLQDKRSQYLASLNDMATSLDTDMGAVNDYLSGKQSQFGTNQQALQKYLGNQQGVNRFNIDQGVGEVKGAIGGALGRGAADLGARNSINMPEVINPGVQAGQLSGLNQERRSFNVINDFLGGTERMEQGPALNLADYKVKNSMPGAFGGGFGSLLGESIPQGSPGMGQEFANMITPTPRLTPQELSILKRYGINIGNVATTETPGYNPVAAPGGTPIAPVAPVVTAPPTKAPDAFVPGLFGNYTPYKEIDENGEVRTVNPIQRNIRAVRR